MPWCSMVPCSLFIVHAINSTPTINNSEENDRQIGRYAVVLKLLKLKQKALLLLELLFLI